MFYGEPTPALAMWGAQSKFATDKCLSEGLIEDVKGAEIIRKTFDGNMRKYWDDEEVAAAVNLFYAKYSAAWERSAPEVRAAFCDGLRQEIAARGFWWGSSLAHIRGNFSPISEKSAKRSRGIVALLSVIPAAASVAAANDAVSASKAAAASAQAGSFNTSNQQLAHSNQLMALSRDFGDVSAAASNVASDSINLNSDELTSVMDEIGPDGTKRVVRCPVVDHFYSYTAPAESPIWSQYHRLVMKCRTPRASDLHQMGLSQR